MNDFASILDSQTINDVTNIITELEAKTTAEIVVVTVENLQGISIEEYAVNLFEKMCIRDS